MKHYRHFSKDSSNLIKFLRKQYLLFAHATRKACCEFIACVLILKASGILKLFSYYRRFVFYARGQNSLSWNSGHRITTKTHCGGVFLSAHFSFTRVPNPALMKERPFLLHKSFWIPQSRFKKWKRSLDIPSMFYRLLNFDADCLFSFCKICPGLGFVFARLEETTQNSHIEALTLKEIQYLFYILLFAWNAVYTAVLQMARLPYVATN